MTEDLAEKWMFAVTGARRCPRCGSITFKKIEEQNNGIAIWRCIKCEYFEERFGERVH